jgi:hypothetical protein
MVAVRMHAVRAAVVTALLASAACAPGIPQEALMLSPESLQQRQLQTRRFETMNEGELLSASAAVLQDLGFTIDESETPLGLIVGSKDRDATDAGQVAGAVVMAVLFGVYMPVDKDQKIRVSLVTRPVADSGSINVRVTFQRTVWNTQRQISKIEGLNEPIIYQQFFNKLSESVFLQAHEI